MIDQVAIPVITFNIVYPVNGFKGVKIARDHNASVPPGGSLHADWFEGWDPKPAKPGSKPGSDKSY